MEEISTIGIDIAKSVFQVHGIDAVGEVVVRRQLKRRQVLQFFAALRPCLIGTEACATAHHWARELQKLGHEVRLMPPRYVKPYVKRRPLICGEASGISTSTPRCIRTASSARNCRRKKTDRRIRGSGRRRLRRPFKHLSPPPVIVGASGR